MVLQELVESIAEKHRGSGIDIISPASSVEIADFEKQIGFSLPLAFKEFYQICNGFQCEEDIFNMIPLFDIQEYQRDFGENWFYFSEYMHFSDMWGLRFAASGQYEIFNGSYPEKAMTSSLIDFLKRFLEGNVFDKGGLYEWHEELKIK